MFQNDIFDEDQNSTWHAEPTDNYFIVTERYSDNTERVALVLKKDITHLYSPTDASGIRLSYSKWSGDELTLMPDLSPEKARRVVDAIADEIRRRESTPVILHPLNNIKAERSITRFARRIAPVVGGILIAAGLMWMISGWSGPFTAAEHIYRTGMTEQYVGDLNRPEPAHRVNEHSLRQVVSSAVATRDAATQHIRDRLPATPDALTQPQPSAERAAPPDTSTQPTAGEQRLAENLKRADERNIFTVPLSEGHERTLYVFSDPSCPHCRDIEPVLERLSGSFNIRIFPVSVIGGEKSASMAQKVLCESDATARRNAWKALFSPGEEMLFPVKKENGDTKAASDCELASRAVSVNDKAFRAYQFAGTPWVLSDRGQAVPQELLNNATEVALWLKLNDNTTKSEK
ncbi:DsbC family protein [Salmonella enterica subsp. enterica serovar Typhimurium]|nr:DsbC family protein [Salmonella enterica subsp. enterica serovar Typhimurium]